MKLALCLIVKGDEREAEYLKECLKTITSVDKVFITGTYKKDISETKPVEQVANFFGAEFSTFKWTNNFSEARNYNFSQVPREYEYIVWCDADDIWRNSDKLRETIENNPRTDTFALWYLYAFDGKGNPVVVHQKTRVIRNDGSIKWIGRLHEDFTTNRNIVSEFIKGIDVIHTADDVHFEQAKGRNLEVALAQLEDLPNDPRSYWNAGNSYKAAGHNLESIEMFDKFFELSQSEEEKYIAHLRQGENYMDLGKTNKAIDHMRTAIGLRPEYPDAYLKLGKIFKDIGRNGDAVEYIKNGLRKPIPYHTIIVFNPREYDYIPFMHLSEVYTSMGQPKLALECLKTMHKIIAEDGLKKLIQHTEKLVKKYNKLEKKLVQLEKMDDAKLKLALEKLEPEFQSHPMVCRLRNTRFVKTESTGKDIAYFCGMTSGEWNPRIAEEKGVGGSEEAVIHLSKRWAKQGYNVTVYNSCGYKEEVFDGVTYKPFWMFNARDKHDVVICWRNLHLADLNLNTTKLFIDVHDMIKPGEFTEERLKKVDKVFLKSNFHRSVFPTIPDEKVVIVPNGIDTSVFEGDFEKDPYLIVNTSSPDRSLSSFIEGFKKVKEKVPKAKAIWAYGWDVFDSVHASNPQLMEWKEEIVKKMKETEGFTNAGKLSHGEVAKLYQRGSVFGYPSEFAEIDCISLSKAMAAGCYPVTTDFAAMGDKKGHGGIFLRSQKDKDTWCLPNQFDFAYQNTDEWADAVIEALEGDVEDTDYMRDWALEEFDWDKITNIWSSQFTV